MTLFLGESFLFAHLFSLGATYTCVDGGGSVCVGGGSLTWIYTPPFLQVVGPTSDVPMAFCPLSILRKFSHGLMMCPWLLVSPLCHPVPFHPTISFTLVHQGSGHPLRSGRSGRPERQHVP